MEEIDRQLKENGDPLFHSADKPLRIAQMVAKEFGHAPKGKTVKQPAKPTEGKPPKKKSPVQPASGNARTVPTDTTREAEKQLENVKSIYDFEELVDSMT